MQRGQVVVLVQSGRELALGDGMVPPVGHVLFTRP